MRVYALAGTVIKVYVASAWVTRVLRALLRPFTKGEVAAFALGHRVVCLSEPELRYLYHEAVHARQAERYPLLIVFWLAYLWESVKHGYRYNKFEAEARSEAEAIPEGLLL